MTWIAIFQVWRHPLYSKCMKFCSVVLHLKLLVHMTRSLIAEVRFVYLYNARIVFLSEPRYLTHTKIAAIITIMLLTPNHRSTKGHRWTNCFVRLSYISYTQYVTQNVCLVILTWFKNRPDTKSWSMGQNLFSAGLSHNNHICQKICSRCSHSLDVSLKLTISFHIQIHNTIHI